MTSISSSTNHILLGTDEKFIKDFNLIEIQKNFWQRFLDRDLKEIVQEFFPIETLKFPL